MTIRRTLVLAALAALALTWVAGCGNRPKYPSKNEVETSNKAREEAIDRDPTIKDKEKMKAILNGQRGPAIK